MSVPKWLGASLFIAVVLLPGVNSVETVSVLSSLHGGTSIEYNLKGTESTLYLTKNHLYFHKHV
ncbi:MAG: hypothetical protein JWR38_926 [Mucilaginibacter sp.]|nr:hypothetical protein [Mucilaginibacter sp.]